jgi:hypothetical protein
LIRFNSVRIHCHLTEHFHLTAVDRRVHEQRGREASPPDLSFRFIFVYFGAPRKLADAGMNM